MGFDDLNVPLKKAVEQITRELVWMEENYNRETLLKMAEELKTKKPIFPDDIPFTQEERAAYAQAAVVEAKIIGLLIPLLSEAKKSLKETVSGE
jgi:hypothetical protein